MFNSHIFDPVLKLMETMYLASGLIMLKINLAAVDNVCIVLQGFFNKDRTLKSGFPPLRYAHGMHVVFCFSTLYPFI